MSCPYRIKIGKVEIIKRDKSLKLQFSGHTKDDYLILKNMSRKSTEEIITYFTGFKNMNPKLDLDKY